MSPFLSVTIAFFQFWVLPKRRPIRRMRPRSYLHLTKARFGDAIEIEVAVPNALHDWKVPPLSLQVILDHILYTNAASKRSPLMIRIGAEPAGRLTITHSLVQKAVVRDLDVDEGMDNLVRKYALLNAPEVIIRETEGYREIALPLFAPNFQVA